MVFVSYPKTEIYDVTYLRTINRWKYETLYTLPPKKDAQEYSKFPLSVCRLSALWIIRFVHYPCTTFFLHKCGHVSTRPLAFFHTLLSGRDRGMVGFRRVYRRHGRTIPFSQCFMDSISIGMGRFVPKLNLHPYNFNRDGGLTLSQAWYHVTNMIKQSGETPIKKAGSNIASA
jgi:hypothetical protein